MYKIEPPFEERELDEIISIAHSTTEEWVPEIRELAKRELIRRNVSLEMQNEIINKWNQDLQEWLTNNSTESYSKWEMIKIIILAPAYLTCRATPNLSLSELKSNNYLKKHKQRIALLIAGVIGYFLFLIALGYYVDYSSRIKADRADITEWENNRIPSRQ